MHFWIVLGHFATLSPRPDHESVHGPLDVVVAVVRSIGILEELGFALELELELEWWWWCILDATGKGAADGTARSVGAGGGVELPVPVATPTPIPIPIPKPMPKLMPGNCGDRLLLWL